MDDDTRSLTVALLLGGVLHLRDSSATMRERVGFARCSPSPDGLA
jgi:hypothetical protein